MACGLMPDVALQFALAHIPNVDHMLIIDVQLAIIAAQMLGAAARATANPG